MTTKGPSWPANYSVCSSTLLLFDYLFQLTGIVTNSISNDSSKLTCRGRERVKAKRKQTNLSLTGHCGHIIRYVTVFEICRGPKSGHSGRGILKCSINKREQLVVEEVWESRQGGNQKGEADDG